ncbi:MAG: hypothetical protein M0D55_10865 [Elusimicrobiota bacterium]|nr:MAG: hypothetical protein M0D55_10865 [Elusimicrobiota bacterium]
MTPALQRRRLGALCAGFGLLLLAPLVLGWLSAHGPAPMTVTGAAWSRYYFGTFVALVAAGYGLLLVEASSTKVFHGGPMIDFSIGVAGAMIAYGFGRGWVPGLFLALFGLRLASGRALLGR